MAESHMNGFSRDLLAKYMNGNHFAGKFAGKSFNAVTGKQAVEDDGGDIELSLGLSLNGKFGVDPNRAAAAAARQNLVRSSSITSFMISGGNEANPNARVAPVVRHAPLARTCSLPPEAEKEWRKRKEMQSLRRMEAKRKRLERKNVRAVREKVDVEENGAQNSVNGQVAVSINGGFNGVVNGNGLPSSQESMGSQGSGSSGISDLESQPIQGAANKSTESRTSSNALSPPAQNEQRPGVTTPAATFSDAAEKDAKESLRHAMAEMPCVATKGDGPNGKRIEGFLYRYRKGEEVRIMCVCHGSFLTPAEFVKHAGGGDVANPLRHIVVNPSPFLS